MKARLRALAAAISLATIGCGDSGGGGTPIPLADLGPTLLDILCTRDARCGSFPDKATCLASNSAATTQLMADVAAGTVKYDAAAAGTCFDSFRAVAASGCTYSAAGMAQLNDPACDRIVTGTLADGAACFDGGECISGSCSAPGCNPTDTCCAGACDRTVAQVAIGGDCTFPARCVQGAYCRLSVIAGGASNVCSAFIAAGQPCDQSMGEQCAPGYQCHHEQPTSAVGVCARAPATGAACVTSEFCDGIADFCDPTTLKCVAKVAVGGACPNGYGCVDYAFCDAATFTCVARGRAGEACDPASTALTCLGSLTCAASACALPPAPPACP
jgi:hypothetical protein